MNISPVGSASNIGGEFKVAAGSSVRCSVTFLNPKRFAGTFNGEEADASLVIQTSEGTRISPNFVFSRNVVGQQYLQWVVEERHSSHEVPR